jgi:hypothetical protein
MTGLEFASTLSWGRRKHRLLIPRPGPYLSPALITGLNQSLPAGGQRLWFLDHGPPLAIVTRATAAEHAALRELTGIRPRGSPAPCPSHSGLPGPPGPGPRPPAAKAESSRARTRAARVLARHRPPRPRSRRSAG